MCVRKLCNWKDPRVVLTDRGKEKASSPPPVSSFCPTFHHCWLHTAQLNRLWPICHVVSDPGAEGAGPDHPQHLLQQLWWWCCPGESERAAPGRWWHRSNPGVAGGPTVGGPMTASAVVWGRRASASPAPSSHGMSEQLAGPWDDKGTYSLSCCLGWTSGVGRDVSGGGDDCWLWVRPVEEQVLLSPECLEVVCVHLGHTGFSLAFPSTLISSSCRLASFWEGLKVIC